MMAVLIPLLGTLRDGLRSRATLQLEVLALRHQLHVLERTRTSRPVLTRADRLLWVWLARVWSQWRAALVIVEPETVISWHRRGFRLLWTWKSRHRTAYYPKIRPKAQAGEAEADTDRLGPCSTPSRCGS